MLATQMQDIRAYVSLCHTDAREIPVQDFLRCMKERSLDAFCRRTAATVHVIYPAWSIPFPTIAIRRKPQR